MPGAPAPSKIRRKQVDEGGGVKITSLMDMMTIILVFLLKTFSTQGDLSSSAANLVLPKSNVKDRPGMVDRVAIGQDLIYYLESEVMSTPDAIAEKMRSYFIPTLLAPMEARIAEIIEMDARAGRESPDPPKIVILAHTQHLYSLIEGVVATAGQAGYQDVSLAALQDLRKWE